MNGVRLPLALSLAGHAALFAALCLLAIAPPPPATAPAQRGIELVLAPPQAPASQSAPAPRPATPKPPAVRPPPKPAARPVPPKPEPVRPPKPAPPPAATPKPAVAPPPAHAPAPVVVQPPRPQHKPVLRRVVRPVLRPVPRRPPQRARLEPPMPRSAPSRPIPMPPAPAPRPALPAPAAPAQATVVTSGYRVLLRDWLEEHKRYPEAARERGEEGMTLLRFRVDRSGRVLDYAVVRSSGYADLDNAVAAMMRGALLPAFPPDMPEQSLTISVTIRFGLR